MSLFKFGFKRQEKPSAANSLLSRKEVESADKFVAKSLESASKRTVRGKYNCYTPEQRAQIGKYAAENGATNAAKRYSASWGININESTARRLKSEYLEKLQQEVAASHSQEKHQSTSESITIKALETKERGRPLFLGAELDAAVQEYVKSLREANGVVNTVVVMAAANGIISARDISKLSSHGGHIVITKSWARSLLNRMGYVKRKCSTSGKIPPVQFEESREIFLADVAAEVVMNEIPMDLIINWDQTALSVIPTGEWTMEKQGAKVVPIANADDKRQLTAVLAVTAGGEYLPPQLLYKGKTARCHPPVTFPDGWDVWHTDNRWSNEETMKRYIEKIIVPFVTQKRKALKLEALYPAMAIFDGFKGQTTSDIRALLNSHNIVAMQLPPNCTDKLQPLDISINKPMKDHMKAKFQQWYANEVRKQLETISVKQVKVDVGLSVVKGPSANWIISGWQALEHRPDVAINGFKKSGIFDMINV